MSSTRKQNHGVPSTKRLAHVEDAEAAEVAVAVVAGPAGLALGALAAVVAAASLGALAGSFASRKRCRIALKTQYPVKGGDTPAHIIRRRREGETATRQQFCWRVLHW